MDNRDSGRLLLCILAGGGFTFETRCLLQSIQDDASFVYLTVPFGGLPGADGIPDGHHYPVPMFATVTENSKLQSVKAFVATFVRTLRVLHSAPVTGVIGIGCSHLVPMLLAARLMGRKTLYIESITRADRLSLTGRIVYSTRLAKTFLVQWPELTDRFPRATLGSIL